MEKKRAPFISPMGDRIGQYPKLLLDALCRFDREDERLYLSGGTVRDWLLGRKSADLDFTVRSGAVACCRSLRSWLGGGALVPLGDEREDMARLVWEGFTVDVTGFREKTATIEDDLKHRDFTINAMAVGLAELIQGRDEILLIDPTNGFDDLRAGVLRACEGAFPADPLRILRGYRLRAVLDFAIEALTREAMQACCSSLDRVAAERISSELDLVVGSDRARPVIAEMADSGVLWRIVPELLEGLGLRQPGFHHLDVLSHNIETLGCLEEILAAPEKFFPGSGRFFAEVVGRKRVHLKWAALLHDLGKPRTMSPASGERGRVTFYNHDRVGRDMFLGIAGRLKWSNQAKNRVGGLIEMHMHPFHLCNIRRTSALTRRACLKIWKRAGDDLDALFLLAMADSLASQGEQKPEGMETELSALLLELRETIDRSIKPALAGPRLVNGADLIHRFRLSPGPLFSKILNELDLAVVEGHVHDRNEALEWVGRHLRDGGEIADSD